MSEAVKLIDRAVKVINSCKTNEHFTIAEKYIKLVCRRYSKTDVGDDMFRGMKQELKAEELKLELLQLLHNKNYWPYGRITQEGVYDKTGSIA